MNPIIEDFILKLYLERGEIKQYENMAVLPLFYSPDANPDYMLLQEALEKKLLTVTEVNQGGSVPELKVINKADSCVLILDGEELVGAKQNRVLNTTVLLGMNSETVIPVSCVERGRWSYTSYNFANSDCFMPSELRSIKNYSVSASLGKTGKYRSDQHAIWNGVHKLACKADACSSTEAMNHVFKAKKAELDRYLEVFRFQPQQKGLLVFINGKIVGLDAVSSPSALEKLYPRLIRSYGMDAITKKNQESSQPSLEKVERFFPNLRNLEEAGYQSVGQGQDYRYFGRSIIGSALVYENKVIHAAFFRNLLDERETKIAYGEF